MLWLAQLRANLSFRFFWITVSGSLVPLGKGSVAIQREGPALPRTGTPDRTPFAWREGASEMDRRLARRQLSREATNMDHATRE